MSRTTKEEHWNHVYRSGDHAHWEFRVPSQELVAIIAAGLVPAGGTVLELGCGGGRESIFLAKCGFRVIGVDISSEALAIAVDRMATEGVSVDWREADVLSLPVEESSVDFACDRGCFHMLPDEERSRYGAEVARVLKPGGLLVIRGCRDVALAYPADGQTQFHAVTTEAIDRTFPSDLFSRGAVLPIAMADDGGYFPGNIGVLRRR